MSPKPSLPPCPAAACILSERAAERGLLQTTRLPPLAAALGSPGPAARLVSCLDAWPTPRRSGY